MNLKKYHKKKYDKEYNKENFSYFFYLYKNSKLNC